MAKKQISWDQLFTYDSLVHAIAGASGGITAMTVFYPLDIVRSRLQIDENAASKSTIQIMREIVAEEGIEGLYRGLEPVLCSLLASNFVYFYTYHGLRSAFSSYGSGHSAWRDLAIGAIAGTVNVFLTSPFWVVNTRMKMQGAKLKSIKKATDGPRYSNIFHGLREIINKEGAATLWAGAVPSLVLVSNPSIQFMCYDLLKRRLQLMTGKLQFSAAQVIFMSAISKTFSTVLTYPIQLVQNKLRYGDASTKDKDMVQLLRMIIKRDGFGGLFKGLEAKIYSTVLTTALMFFFYESIADFVFKVLKPEKFKK